MAGKYETPRGQAATNAKRKYNAENYDRIYPMGKKGKKAVYQAAATAAGMSLNEWIETALDAAAERSKDGE